MTSNSESTSPSPAMERLGTRLIGLLLIVSATSALGLWTQGTTTISGESLYACYMSIDLVSFATIIYIYSALKSGAGIRRVPLIAGLCMLLLLMVVALAV